MLTVGQTWVLAKWRHEQGLHYFNTFQVVGLLILLGFSGLFNLASGSFLVSPPLIGLPRLLSGKESVCQCRRHGFDPWVRKMPCRRKWLPIPGFSPEKSDGHRSLGGYSPWDFPGKNTGVGCHFFLQGIFLIQGSNPCLLHWQTDSLPLSHQGSPLAQLSICTMELK